MAFRPSISNTLLLVAVLVILLPAKTYAFGAGDIPDFAYLNDKAFRHGDIENILEELLKSAGGGGLAIGGGSLLGIASSVLKQVATAGGSKFSKSDVKKVYFGNWLRDYSQAMDIAGLSKLTADTLVLVVGVLGFMTFGFATQEFEVTADRLGVYLPVEHIDNPKGYAEKEGDARQFHPKLRPPVQSQELEIDERTGMKKYMATENQGWDTSTAFIRRTFRACIEAGRRAQGQEGAELWEAYRLLGTGLHTMEDLLAHSNWCEIALRKLGYNDVFCHVGDNVSVNTPNGRAPPLVTGTFGSADFLHSLLGEAGDKLSQASVTDLSSKLSDANQGKGNGPDISMLKGIFSKFGGGGDDKLNKGEDIKQQAQAYNFNPDDVAPPEVKQQLIEILRWHDDVMRDIIKKMEMIPGLTDLLEEFSNALNAYIYTIVAPYLSPILTQATGALDEGSKAVIDNDDQYEVFNNANAHDPSHSLLSKDHFGLILNEPAGKIAQIVVQHSVNLIVRSWSDNSNPDDIITQILEAFHHPYYASGRSEIQNKMFDQMQKWIGGQGQEAREIISSLTKEAVREHRNKRKGLEDTVEVGYAGCGHTSSGNPSYTKSSAGAPAYGGTAGYNAGNSGRNQSNTSSQSQYGRTQSHGQGQTGGYSQTQQSGGYGQSQQSSGYGSQRRDDDENRGGRRQDTDTYGSGYSQSQQSGGYGSQRRDDNENIGGRRQDADSYGSTRRDGNEGTGYGSQQSGYGQKQQTSDGYAPSYGGSTGGYGSQRRDEDSNSGYGSQRRDEDSRHGGGYGGNKRDDDDNRGSGYEGHKSHKSHETQQSYGRREESDNTYGSSGYGQKSETTYGSGGGYTPSYGGQTESSGYGGNKHHGRDDDDDDRRKKSYGQSEGYGSSTAGYGGSGGTYGGRGDDDSNRNRHESNYGSNQTSGYGQTTSGYGQEASGGYAPSYGGNNETFGAERLNIGGGGRDDDDDDEQRKRRHHHQGGGGGGYGNSGYEGGGGGYGGGY